MAGYIVIGGGAASEKALKASLAELQSKAEEAEEDFWFEIPLTDEEPAESLGMVLDWLVENEVFFNLYVAPDAGLDEAWEEAAAKTVDAKNPLKSAMMALTKEKLADAALVLFDDDDETLVDTLGLCADAGLRLLELNKGLEPIQLGDDEPEPEPEEKPRTRRSKAAADPEQEVADDLAEQKAKRGRKAAEPDEPDYEAMGVRALRKLAKDSGIEDAGSMTKEEVIAALKGGDPEADDEPEDRPVEKKPARAAKEAPAPSRPVEVQDGPVLVVLHLATGFHTTVVSAERARAIVNGN